MIAIKTLTAELQELEAAAAAVRNQGFVPYPASFCLDSCSRGNRTYYRKRLRLFNGKLGKAESVCPQCHAKLAAELARGRELHRLQQRINQVREQLERAVVLVERLGGKVARKNVLLSSESNEWYTPPEFIEFARAVMGGIDIDPASNEVAQTWIQATTWYSRTDDGFGRDWHGRLWLNPPYGKRGKGNHGAGAWIEKAIAQYDSGNVSQAVLLVRGDSEGFKELVRRFPCCEPFDRIRFVREDGTPSDKPVPGCRFFYLGTSIDHFRQQFATVGVIYSAI